MNPLLSDSATRSLTVRQLCRCAEAQSQMDYLALGKSDRFEHLHRRWEVLSSLGEWTQCMRVAQEMIADGSDEACGWLYLAEALKNADGGTLQMAYDVLVSATKTVREPVLFFALAHYAVDLRDFVHAREWLAKAVDRKP